MKSAADRELMVEQLAAGHSEPILVVDFEPFTAAPRIAELLTGRTGGHPVYQVDPLSALSRSQDYLPIRDLAAIYADDFLSSRPADGRIFVVSHCSAAALSMHVTQRLVGSRQATVLLLEPTWPGTQHIKELFAELQANLGASGRPCPELREDPRDTLERMEEILREEMAEIVARNRLDGSAEVFSDLLVRYKAWLAYVLACRDDTPAVPLAGAALVKVLARTPDATVPGLNPDAYAVTQFQVNGQRDPDEADLAELALGQIMAG
jgi:hypothetical protein